MTCEWRNRNKMATHTVELNDLTFQKVQDGSLNRVSDSNSFLGHERNCFGRNDGERKYNKF
jgi:hypothetical protein